MEQHEIDRYAAMIRASANQGEVMSDETTVKMLPCPFCGGTDIDAGFSKAGDGTMSAGCMTCSACGPDKDTRDPDVAARAWNERQSGGSSE